MQENVLNGEKDNSFDFFVKEIDNNNLDKAWDIYIKNKDNNKLFTNFEENSIYDKIKFDRGYRKGFDGNWHEYDTDSWGGNNNSGGNNNDDGDCCGAIMSLVGLAVFTCICSVFLHKCCWCALWDEFWECVDCCGCTK